MTSDRLTIVVAAILVLVVLAVVTVCVWLGIDPEPPGFELIGKRVAK